MTQLIDQIIIQPATPNEAQQAGYLMALAFGDFAQYLFGTNHEERILEYFRQLWIHQNNRMSSKYSYVIRDYGKPVAMLSCSSGDMTNSLFLKSFWAIIKVNPGLIKYLLLHPRYVISLLTSPEAFHDEFYIFALAVDPAYQQKGLGSKLLDFAEEQARSLGFHKCSIMAEADNKIAITLYERKGYKKDRWYHKNPFNHYRLVKDLR